MCVQVCAFVFVCACVMWMTSMCLGVFVCSVHMCVDIGACTVNCIVMCTSRVT